LRGVSLTFVVLDEYADMKAQVWEQIIRASLSDRKGDALFIGTPKGRNHFYDVWQNGTEESETYDPEYKSWHFTTEDNELIDPAEVEAARRTLSSFAFKQEYQASFDNAGANVFKEEWIKYGPEPKFGSYFVACDLAGFEAVAVANTARKKRLDQTAIAIVKVSDDGKWWVKNIVHGRWDIRETAVKILMAVREVKPQMVGIEKGTTFNAVMPYLSDLMRKNNLYFHIKPLTHSNEKKVDRIVWALQGMFEHGRIILNDEGANQRNSWQSEFKDELIMFPTKDVHDDLVDGLSLINQMAVTSYNSDENDYQEEVLDVVVGF
jgi:phage terminase large subunit-like protein